MGGGGVFFLNFVERRSARKLHYIKHYQKKKENKVLQNVYQMQKTLRVSCKTFDLCLIFLFSFFFFLLFFSQLYCDMCYAL